jgi:hypothetical protein
VATGSYSSSAAAHVRQEHIDGCQDRWLQNSWARSSMLDQQCGTMRSISHTIGQQLEVF